MRVALMAAACGPSGDSVPNENVNADARGETQSQVLGGEPRSGGVMRFASVEGPDYMDPGAAYSATYFSYIARGVTRTLTTYKASTDLGEQAELVGDLATGLGKHNAAGTKWTYTLKEGIKFGLALGGEKVPGVTGEPITSADLKYALRTPVHVLGRRSVPLLLRAGRRSGRIPGRQSRRHLGHRDSGRQDDHVQSHGAHRRLGLPDGDAGRAPVPESFASQFDAKGDFAYDSHIVASGPYYVETYVPSERIVMKRDPN
ncbi:MAG: hypothetical protein H0V97_08245 [Actinobacteria bacterium]|nr:hypothetical protein [Actinomycetota bacterium]